MNLHMEPGLPPHVALVLQMRLRRLSEDEIEQGLWAARQQFNFTNIRHNNLAEASESKRQSLYATYLAASIFQGASNG